MNRVMSGNPVLVTGATGRHGNTGEYLVERLREAGCPVRVLARTLSERTERLAVLGAEVVLGDLHDRRTLLPALDDVDLAYFTYPVDAGIIPAAANYASAVRQVGRRPRTVVMSMGPSHPDSPSKLGRAQWLAEDLLQAVGLDLLILRVAALFHENLAVLHGKSIRERGLIQNSFGPGEVAWISGRDAAEVARAALLHPERFHDTVYYAKGSEALSHVAIASLLTALTRAEVRYRAVTRDEWRTDLEELARSSGGDVVNPAMAQHISAIGQMVATAGPTLPADCDALAALIDREPVTMQQFLQDNMNTFAAPAVH